MARPTLLPAVAVLAGVYSLASFCFVGSPQTPRACSRVPARVSAEYLERCGPKDSDVPFNAGAASGAGATVEFKKRPFGILRYQPGEGMKGAMAMEIIPKSRYPGDPQGQAFASGVQSGWVVQSINGMNVQNEDFGKIMDMLDDEVADPRFSKSTALALEKQGGRMAEPVAESILDKVDAATSMAAEAKEFARALVEEFSGTTTGDDFPCCCCDICCDDDCCNAFLVTSSSTSNRRRKQGSLLEAPGQEEMGGEQPSLLERIARLSSEDLGEVLRHVMKTDKWTAKEKFGLWLFEKKFGGDERNNLEKCVEQVKKETPGLMKEDHVTKKDVEQKKNSDAKVAAKFVKMLAATTLTKHGAAIAGTGLGAVGLQHCEPVLCAGDLKYKLDQTGLHQCTWNCPTGQVPALFQSVGAEMMEELEEVTPLEEEKKEVQEAAKEMESVASSPKEFEKSEAFAQVNKLKLRFHEALSDKPLKLSQTASPTTLGAVKTSAIRYHGKCSPPETFEGQLKRAVLFQGDNKEIPKGSVVEVTRLPATSTLGRVGNFFSPFSSNMKDDEVEVTYQGKEYVVKSKDLQRTAVGKVSMDEGLQDWLLSTGDTIKVQMPPKQQDPKEVLWYPVSGEKEKDA